jgi:hypothetical protein
MPDPAIPPRLTPARIRFLEHARDHAEATAREAGSTDALGAALVDAGLVRRSHASAWDEHLSFYSITDAGRTALGTVSRHR